MSASAQSGHSIVGQAPSVRRLIAAGIKRGPQPWLVEQPAMSDTDRAAHVAASYVRRPAMTP